MIHVISLVVFGCLSACGSHNQPDGNVEIPKAVLPAKAADASTSGQGSEPFSEIRPDLPLFETSAAELNQNVTKILSAADARVQKIVDLGDNDLTFENTFVALDTINHEVANLYNRIALIEATTTQDGLREAANAQDVAVQKWQTALLYREDLFNTLSKFERKFGSSAGRDIEDQHLLEDILKDFKKAGMGLSKSERNAVQTLKDQLAELGVQFDNHIRSISGEVEFTKEELKGVPDVESLKRGEKYIVDVSTSPQYLLVAENASLESTRKKLEVALHSRAVKENAPVLEQMIRLRDQIAKALGYTSWDDYRLDGRMAKDVPTLRKFLNTFSKKLRPKFEAELAEFKKLKADATGLADPLIHIWDWRYFKNQYEKAHFNIDMESLRPFFEMSRVQRGIFEVYEDIFGIKIKETDAPYKWVADLKLFSVSDASSGKVLGYFYLDLYPRKNKYKHFAEFGIVNGKKLSNGSYRKPVVSLVCNFPKPTADVPSLLKHEDVTTFFHEFGHAMHAILTTAKYDRFSGTNVPQDFVEAPSQMLEAWGYDVEVLNRFAADYRDPTRKIDPEIMKRLKEAKLATMGMFYSRQLALGMTDLKLHEAGEIKNSQRIVSENFKDYFLPVPAGTNFSANWGHLNGYDGSYYGYAWADSIAQDMLNVFRKAPLGLLDKNTGRKLRNEIYARGWSRPIDESIEKFLGRPFSLNAFYESVGINH
jgi:thimet oligopeptidase